MVNLNTNDASLWGRDPAHRQALVQEFVEKLGVIVTRKQVIAFLQSTGRTQAEATWLFNNRAFRASRGQYTLQPLIADGDTVTVSQGASLS
jgi:hemolysin-activating ACP:hemolysin acyltransferase